MIGGNIKSQRCPVPGTYCMRTIAQRLYVNGSCHGIHNGIHERDSTRHRVPCAAHTSPRHIGGTIVGGTAGRTDKVALLVEDFEHKTWLLRCTVVNIVENTCVFKQQDIGI